ncbi:MAG: 30S ribosomal protein S6 [Candidatus Omnitrophica bacterium]|nr:30S ribosomal protein S6 [Candidatus Omnitrophota bacterium]MDD5671108.1 30S ribosomal protein S6 [Candidatus Omnitrophota bacterium]
MKAYEGVFIYPPDSGTDTREREFRTLDDLIKKFQGTITEKIDLGRRQLGYSLKKFRDGYFLVLHFQMDPAKIDEFRKALELSEEVLKYMLTVKDLKAAAKLAKRAAAQAAKPAAPAPAPAPSPTVS